jgi:hypothetical protein
MQYVALEELLVKVEVSCAHYLVKNKSAPHCTCPLQHIDYDASHHPSCKAKLKGYYYFYHPLPNK